MQSNLPFLILLLVYSVCAENDKVVDNVNPNIEITKTGVKPKESLKVSETRPYPEHNYPEPNYNSQSNAFGQYANQDQSAYQKTNGDYQHYRSMQDNAHIPDVTYGRPGNEIEYNQHNQANFQPSGYQQDQQPPQQQQQSPAQHQQAQPQYQDIYQPSQAEYQNMPVDYQPINEYQTEYQQGGYRGGSENNQQDYNNNNNNNNNDNNKSNNNNQNHDHYAQNNGYNGQQQANNNNNGEYNNEYENNQKTYQNYQTDGIYNQVQGYNNEVGNVYRAQEIDDTPKTLVTPLADYGGFRPVIKNNAMQNDYNYNYRPGYEAAKTYENINNNQNNKIFDSQYDDKNVYQQNDHQSSYSPEQQVYTTAQEQSHQVYPQQAANYNTMPNAGYTLDYGSGKPYNGDLSRKPYSIDNQGVTKVIEMPAYDEKANEYSSASYQAQDYPSSLSNYNPSEFTSSSYESTSTYSTEYGANNYQPSAKDYTDSYGDNEYYIDNQPPFSSSSNYGGYSLAENTYMQSLFGFPTYDTSSKSNPYTAGTNNIAINTNFPTNPFNSLLSNTNNNNNNGKGLSSAMSSLIPSIKLTNTGIRLSGFGSTINTGIGASLNQALASTLGGNSNSGSNSAGSSSPFYSTLYSSLGLRGVGPLSGSNFGSSTSKIIPSVIRSPFRTMYRALTGASITR